jgi:beta-galactosidase
MFRGPSSLVVFFLRSLVCAVLWHTALVGAPREERQLVDGWRFHEGDEPAASAVDFDDARWRQVSLPHDWSIVRAPDPTAPAAGHGGYFHTGTGWYRLRFDVPPGRDGRRVEIEFEGAAMGAEVWCNGVPLGRWAYGYTPFRFDLTPHLRAGANNVLSVRVDNSAQPNSRWYSGSGLYRPVWLRVTDPVRVPAGGVWVTTEELNARQARLRVHAEVASFAAENREIAVEVDLRDPRGRSVGEARTTVTLAANATWSGAFDLTVEQPRTWSPESPRLHRVVTRVRESGGRLLDETFARFGIRTVRVSPERGFELNGRVVKLLGGNVHHDTGPLGAAAFARAEERKVELLKAAGFNAVRTAHNPPSVAFLDACDRLGLLVVDEIFDGWEKAKNQRDYGRLFAEWWARDVDAWVRRDRHHASVVMWSAGNEMFERGNAEGLRIAGELAARIRGVDPTRAVTAGVNGLAKPEDWPKLDPLFARFDVAGYNYELHRHGADHARLPRRVLMAAESYQSEAFANWAAMTDHPYVIGDFVWSALDYLGEAGIGRVFPPGQEARKHWEAEMFPWHGAYCGDLDLTGWRKPASYYRQIVWDRGEKLYAAVRVPPPGGGEWNLTPWSMAPTLPSWTWPGQEGRSMSVEVYSRHDAVRLELDGRVLGELPTTRAEEFKAVFTVPYAPGELKTVGLRGARAVETFTLHTAGSVAQLRLRADRAVLRADGQDLAFVTIEALDRQGVWQPQAEQRLSVRVEGAGTLAALGSGDLTAIDTYAGPTRSLYQGRALAVVRAGTRPGKIALVVEAPGLPVAKLLLKTTSP